MKLNNLPSPGKYRYYNTNILQEWLPQEIHE